MPFNIIHSTISDINPTVVGGIINVDNGEVIFKNNEVLNIISSTSAPCFFITNSKLNISNSCFTRCAARGGNGAFGNIGDIQSRGIRFDRISAFQCSFSTSQTGDSVFSFSSCSDFVKNYNSSYCYGLDGSCTFRSSSNTISFDVSFMTCSSGIDCTFVENYHFIPFKKCAFINSTKVTSYMICSLGVSLFDSCCFFMMANTKFCYSVSLVNCYSDEAISGYSLTVCSNINDVLLPIPRKPLCKIGAFCTNKNNQKNLQRPYFLVVM